MNDDRLLPLPATAGGGQSSIRWAGDVERISGTGTFEHSGAGSPVRLARFHCLCIPVIHQRWLLLLMMVLTYVRVMDTTAVWNDLSWDMFTVLSILGVITGGLGCLLIIGVALSQKDWCSVGLAGGAAGLCYISIAHGGKYLQCFTDSIDPAMVWPWRLLAHPIVALVQHNWDKGLPESYSAYRVAAMGAYMYYFWLTLVVHIWSQQENRACGRMLLMLFGFTPIGILVSAINTNRILGELLLNIIAIFRDMFQGEWGKIAFVDWFLLFVLLWWLLLPWPVSQNWVMRQAAKKHEDLFNDALNNPYYARIERTNTGRLLRSFSTQPNLGGEALDVAEVNVKEKQQNVAKVAKQHHESNLPVGGVAATLGRISINVARSRLLQDSLQHLRDKPADQLVLWKLSVQFEGEFGLDLGGVTNDWFESVSKELNKGVEDTHGESLLTVAPDKSLVPRPTGATAQGSSKRPEALNKSEEAKLRQLMDVGRFIAVAVLKEQPIPLALGTPLLKHLLKTRVDFRDVRQLDPDFFRNRVQMVLKEGGVEELNEVLGEPLTFVSAPTELVPTPQPLIEGGAETLVTEQNKSDYVLLLCEAYLVGSIRTEMQMLLNGFWEVLPSDVLRACQVTSRELSVMIAGIQEIDVEQWKQHTAAGSSSRVIVWFWEVVAEFTSQQRSLLLAFTTGSSRLPPGGFADLEPEFKLEVNSQPGDHLPHSHTCFNQLILPEYESKEQLKTKLLTTISLDGVGFGFG